MIQKQINNVTYCLELPSSIKIHSIIHVSLLERYKELNIPSQRQPPPPMVEVNNHIEFEVEEVLDSRIRYRRLQYLFYWHGYDINNYIWKRVDNLVNTQMKVLMFHQ